MNIKWVSQAALRKENPRATVKEGFNIKDHVRVGDGLPPGVIAEFVGAGQFASAFYERQRYEVFAGRDQEPEVWRNLYTVVEDASLPESIPIYTLGPAGVTFEEIKEGGEVKFMTIGESQKSVTIKQYGVALQYTKKLMMFNSMWQMGFIERQAGIAYNALLNHVHLYPIISATYAGARTTSASSVGSTLLEKIMSTLEDAISASLSDTTTPRRGPYALLISSGDAIKIRNALNVRVQDSGGAPRAGADFINTIIEYDGWSGTRGSKTTTYTGVAANTAYLVSLQYKDQDFLSFFKQPLESAVGNPDVSRFIMEQTVWDVWFGMYASPGNAVQKISLPTS